MKFKKFLLMEEERMRLKSRVIWLDLGDRNTKLFHQFANDRRVQNLIWEINGMDVAMVSDSNGIKLEAIKHFHILFSHPGKTSIVDQMNTVRHLL